MQKTEILDKHNFIPSSQGHMMKMVAMPLNGQTFKTFPGLSVPKLRIKYFYNHSSSTQEDQLSVGDERMFTKYW